jgi:histidine ammonia-lyase
MSSLSEIADAKVQAAVTRRLGALTPAIVSIREEMNGRNLLPSSMTATRIHGACISLFDEIRDDMKAEYGMVIDNAFWPTESLGNHLISKAHCHFNIVANRAENEIKSATQSLMNSSMHKQLCNDVAIARDRALTDLSLFIDGHSKIQIHKKTIRAIAYLPKIFWSLIKQ